MWVQSAVRCDDTVTVKVVVGCRIAAVIATIGKYLLTCNLTLVAQALVYKVPDVSTLINRILADKLPVLLESTHRVTHSVGIFTLYQRLHILSTTNNGSLIVGSLVLRILIAVLVAHVHWAEDICLTIQLSTLVLAWASVVISLYPVVSLLEIRTVSSLVT